MDGPPLGGVPYLFIHIHLSTQQPTPSSGRNVQIGNHQRRTIHQRRTPRRTCCSTHQKTRNAFSCDLTNLKRRGDTDVPTRRESSRRVKKTASANAIPYRWRQRNGVGRLFVPENGFEKYFERHDDDQHNGQPHQHFAPRIATFGGRLWFRFQNNGLNGVRVANVSRRNTDGVQAPNNPNPDFVFGDEHGVVWRGDKRRVNVNSFGDNRVPFHDDSVDDDGVGFFE